MGFPKNHKFNDKLVDTLIGIIFYVLHIFHNIVVYTREQNK